MIVDAVSDLKIIVATISGLFALLGGFFGAWLARRTEYEKWLRQQRSSAFSEFISQVHNVRQEAVDIIYDSNITKQEKDIKITELFVGLSSQENIVRLYLKTCDRKSFSDLIHELCVIHNPSVKQPTRLKKVEDLMSDIQSIFEKTIHG